MRAVTRPSRRAARTCRDLADREVLRDTAGDLAATELRRRLAELAVRLAVNAEWAAAICRRHTIPPERPDPTSANAAASDWAVAHDALRYTTTSIIRALACALNNDLP